MQLSHSRRPEDYYIEREPYYEPVGNEIEIFEAAYRNHLPVLLKGPTGCGKTRFMEHMAWRLKRPLITVSCHDDLTASDLVGRYLVRGGETVWVDGPLTRAVRAGGICYLDEVVEARKDTTVVIHPLADDRRVLPIEKLGELVEAAPEFCLAISYNPGYQSVLKDLKQSTRQRFVALEFDYPGAELERRIVTNESGASPDTGRQPREVRADDTQPQGQRTRGRRVYAAAGARGQAHRQRRQPRRGLPERRRAGRHR